MADRLRRQKDIITRKTSSYLNATTKAYTEMYDGTPTFITYYQIDSPASTEDIGLEAVNSLTGADSPIKYRKIEDVKVYGIDALDVSNEISERGLVSSVNGDFVIKPNSIVPVAGDFFTFDYEGLEEHLFRINDIQFDKITPEKYYKCSFSLYPYNNDDILNNISGDYNMEYNSDGSSSGESSVVSSADANNAESVKTLVDELIDKYNTMFYDEDTDSFVYSEGDHNYWCPYLQRFLHDTKALSKYNQELLTEIYIGDINEPNYPAVFKEKFYRQSIFKNIVSKNSHLTFDQTFLSVDRADLKAIRNLPFFNSPLQYSVIRPVDVYDGTGLDYQNAFLAFYTKCPCQYEPELPEYNEEELKKHTLVRISDKALRELKNAVYRMSDEKQGALIVLMGKDDIFSNGTITQPGTVVNKKITEKVLEDMFIVGTPLHDGAAIINGDIILNAAAFVEPSKDPIHGKFGSRHQAALGISETSDSIAIIVSEETGLVSIAFDGRMYTVYKEAFEDDINSCFNKIEKKEETKKPKLKLAGIKPFDQPAFRSLTFFRDADHYHKVHILDELHLARLEEYIKPGDIVYECYRHELEPTKVVAAVDVGEATELRDISLPGLMDNDYTFDNMEIFYIMKSYLKGNLEVNEDLINKLSDFYFEQDIQNYLLMPILIYILKDSIK